MQLPQLDFGSYPSQFFWLVICYSFLYLMLKFVVLPKFFKIYKKREKILNTATEEANKNINEALQLLEIKKAELSAVKKEAAIKISEANAKAEKAFNEQKLIIDHKNTLILNDANTKLQDLKNKLNQSANEEIAKSTSLILKQVFNIEIPPHNILNSTKDKI